jgi:uncharacterized protein
MTEEKISFRPHHFLCALSFQGKGYSPAFIKNFSEIKARLDAPDGDAECITITSHTDSICQPCPHRRDTLCEQQDKITQLDNAHANALGWEVGTTLSWGEAKQQIKQNFTMEKFHDICATCSWKELGICETVFKEI